jgi:hypothetical protein
MSLRKIAESFESLISSKTGYTALFKGFISIAALFLVSTIQVINITLPIEEDALKNKFKVEAELKHQIQFNEMTCPFDLETYEECKIAVYKWELTNASIYALEKFQILLGFLGFILIVLCGVGFLSSAFNENKDQNSNKDIGQLTSDNGQKSN